MSEKGRIDCYRYGYQGSEKDDEVKGGGNSYTTEFRMLDPRLGRWLSIDPLAAQFPWQSPYVSMDNNPICLTDIFGDSTDNNPTLKSNQTQDITTNAETCTYGYDGTNKAGQHIHTVKIIQCESSKLWTSATSYTTKTTITTTQYTYLSSERVDEIDPRVKTAEIETICNGQTVATTTSITNYIESDVLDPNHNTWQTTSNPPVITKTPTSDIKQQVGYRYQMCLQSFLNYSGADKNLFQFGMQDHLPLLVSPDALNNGMLWMTTMVAVIATAGEGPIGWFAGACSAANTVYTEYSRPRANHKGRVGNPSKVSNSSTSGKINTWKRNVPHQGNSRQGTN